MSDQTIHGETAPYSASRALSALGKALGEIKAADHLTYADLGAVLGRSEDQAAKYCEGTATMDAVTFGRAKKEWGGRFTGYFDRLCDNCQPGRASDRQCESSVLKAALALSVALQDGKITPAEIRAERGTIEDARDALEGLLVKLTVAA